MFEDEYHLSHYDESKIQGNKEDFGVTKQMSELFIDIHVVRNLFI